MTTERAPGSAAERCRDCDAVLTADNVWEPGTCRDCARKLTPDDLHGAKATAASGTEPLPDEWLTEVDLRARYDASKMSQEAAGMVLSKAVGHASTVSLLIDEVRRYRHALHLACTDGWADGDGAFNAYVRQAWGSDGT